MLSLPPSIRIFAARAAVDMRKTFDGLSAIARDVLQQDPMSGQLFVFFNRTRDRVKILVWDTSGFWLFYKRLERGTFEELTAIDGTAAHAEIDATTLHLLLDGIELKKVSFRGHLGRVERTSKLHALTSKSANGPRR